MPGLFVYSLVSKAWKTTKIRLASHFIQLFYQAMLGPVCWNTWQSFNKIILIGILCLWLDPLCPVGIAYWKTWQLHLRSIVRTTSNYQTTCNCHTGDQKTELTIYIPKLPGIFTGTGDLFAALLLAWMWRTNNQLKPSLEKVIATLQAVLKRTLHYATGSVF